MWATPGGAGCGQHGLQSGFGQSWRSEEEEKLKILSIGGITWRDYRIGIEGDIFLLFYPGGQRVRSGKFRSPGRASSANHNC